MIRSLKILGLMALAAMAMSAMFASAAQAEVKGVFTAGETLENHTPSTISGEQYGTVNHFFANNSTTICENAGVKFTGANSGTEAHQRIDAEYKDCTAGGLPATVKMNECSYTFTQPTRISIEPEEWTGQVDLTCPTGKKIEIEVFSGGGHTSHTNFRVCRVTVYPKGEAHKDELDGHVIYTAGVKDKKDDITANVTAEGITAVKHGLCGAAHDENGKYTSTVTLTGSEGKKAHDVWISPE